MLLTTFPASLTNNCSPSHLFEIPWLTQTSILVQQSFCFCSFLWHGTGGQVSECKCFYRAWSPSNLLFETFWYSPENSLTQKRSFHLHLALLIKLYLLEVTFSLPTPAWMNSTPPLNSSWNATSFSDPSRDIMPFSCGLLDAGGHRSYFAFYYINHRLENVCSRQVCVLTTPLTTNKCEILRKLFVLVISNFPQRHHDAVTGPYSIELL